MPRINHHYLKLASSYLFPEISRRVEAFKQAHPELADDVIACGIGDVTEPIPPAALQAMHDAIDDLGRRETFKGYGPPTGYDFLRDAIVEHDFRRRGMDIERDEIFISDGSKVDCGAVLDILGGDITIAITDPVYPVYVDTNVMAGNTGPATDDGYEGIVVLPCSKENDFTPDLPTVPVDVVYLCYPNNPTGAMITRERLTEWVRWANETGALILYDVAYEAFISCDDVPRSIYEIDGARTCAMEFHSFSKNGGFTGVRCGYTVCPKELTGTDDQGNAVDMHRLWTRRWATKSNGVSYPVQRGAAALYSDDGRAQVKSLIDHYSTNATMLLNGCRTLGLDVYGGEHAPYVWVACPDGVSSWEMFDRLLHEARVVVTPGAGFGPCGEGYFRISAFNSRANVQEAVQRISALSLVGAGA